MRIIFYIFILIVLVSSSSADEPITIDTNCNDLKEGISDTYLKQQSCSDDGSCEDYYRPCLLEACTKNCKNYMHECKNIKDGDYCKSACEENLLLFTEGNENTDIKRACADENKETIRQEANSQCISAIRSLRSPKLREEVGMP